MKIGTGIDILFISNTLIKASNTYLYGTFFGILPLNIVFKKSSGAPLEQVIADCVILSPLKNFNTTKSSSWPFYCHFFYFSLSVGKKIYSRW